MKKVNEDKKLEVETKEYAEKLDSNIGTNENEVLDYGVFPMGNRASNS